jgi:hypothetical protein
VTRLPARTTSALAGILLAAHAVLAWLTRAPGIETGRDDAMYLQLGRSLLHFGYREIWSPAAPPHLQYPPGYPLLLGLTSALVGEHFDVFIALNIAASVGTLYLAWRVVASRWSPALGLLMLVMLAPNPQLLDRAGQIASEPLYMLLSVGAVALLARADVQPRDRAFAAALAIAAALTRSVGTSLVVALGLLWVLERRWKTVLLYGACASATVGAWLALTIVKAPRIAGVSYVGDAVVHTESGRHFLRGWIESVGTHLATYAAATVPEALAVPTMSGTIIDNVLGAGLVAVLSLAGMFLLWQRWRAGALYLVCAFALLLAWPWGPLRFVAPLLPLIAVALLGGAEWLVARSRPAWGLTAAGIVAVGLATTGAVTDAGVLAERATCVRGSWPPSPTCVSTDRASFYAAAMWIREALPADAIIVTSKNETLAYYAGRHTLPLRAALGEGTLPEAMRRAGTSYLLLGSLHWNEVLTLQGRLAADCRHLLVVRQFPPRTWLFRVTDAEAPDDAGCRAMADYHKASLGRNLDRE